MFGHANLDGRIRTIPALKVVPPLRPTRDSLVTDRLQRLYAPRTPPSIERTLLALVHSNLVVALAATSWVVTTSLLIDRPLDPIPIFIVFAATLFVYSLDRVTDVEADARNVPGRAVFVRRYGRLWLALGISLYLAALALALALSLPRGEFLVLPLIVALLYSTAGLKRLLLVKNLLVGVSWGVIPLGVGVYFGVLRSIEVLFLFGYVAAMVTIAAIVFDVKDIEGDLTDGIRTVPNRFGPRATRRWSAVAAAAVAVVVVGAVLAAGLPSTFLVLLVLNAYVLGYSLAASPGYGPLFYGLVVDGEHVFLAAIVLAFEALVW